MILHRCSEPEIYHSALDWRWKANGWTNVNDNTKERQIQSNRHPNITEHKALGALYMLHTRVHLFAYHLMA